AQCRFRTDRGSKAAGHLRGAEPAAGACHDGGDGFVSHDRHRDEGGAGGPRLAAGFWLIHPTRMITPSWHYFMSRSRARPAGDLESLAHSVPSSHGVATLTRW